jgi:hypothetical protein
MKKKIVAALALSIALLVSPAFADERHDHDTRHHDQGHRHYDRYDRGHHNIVRHIIHHL